MEDADSKIQNIARELIGLIHSNNSIRATNKLMAFRDGGREGRFNLVRLLIYYAQQEDDYIVARWALDTFEKMISKAPRDEGLYYDIANGYQVLYELAVKEDPIKAYEQEDILRAAIKYFEKSNSNPWALTNFGNLYDYIGRPIEAVRYYDRALKDNEQFGMALGNKAQALETLAPVSGYPNVYLIKAYQLYIKALDNEDSVRDVGGSRALENFRHRADHIAEYFAQMGKIEWLTENHPHDELTKKDGLLQFYVEFCLAHELYLNLHLSDNDTDASVGDNIFPVLRTRKEEDEEHYVADIAYRFNEISESFMSARMALVQSQYTNSIFSTISQQTALANNLDYSASNIYIGHLKMAYKEAFSTLDKIAVLLNHYLGLGHSEENVYYHTVWFEKGLDETPRLSERVKNEPYLVGLYLLCQDLRGSKYSNLRNSLTHRYVRIYRGMSGPRGTYTFEELTEITTDVMFKVKCAIAYLSLFITRKENIKHIGEKGRIIKMPLSTRQNLDIW